MQDNHEARFVGDLGALMEVLRVVGSLGRGIGFTAVEDGVAVWARGSHHQQIVCSTRAITGSGSLLLLSVYELRNFVQTMIDEHWTPLHDPRPFVLTMTSERRATLSIDRSPGIPLDAQSGDSMPDLDWPEPTLVKVSHTAFIAAVPWHLAVSLPYPLPPNRLGLMVTPGSLTAVARDRHATIIAPLPTTLTDVPNEGKILHLSPRMLRALRNGTPGGSVEISWRQNSEYSDLVMLRSGGITVSTTSQRTLALFSREEPLPPLTDTIDWAMNHASRVTARFWAPELRKRVETMLRDYAKAWVRQRCNAGPHPVVERRSVTRRLA